MSETCRSCNEVFDSHSKLMSHKLTNHRSEMGNVGFSGRRTCKTCFQEFPSNSELVSHKLLTHRNELFSRKSGPKQGTKFSKDHREKISKSLRIFYGTYNPSIPLGPQERWCHDYEQWMRAVKKRDSYTCQHCGSNKRIYLVAHHIKPYEQFVLLRYDVDNGITLCMSCHMKEEARLKNQRNFCKLFLLQLSLLSKKIPPPSIVPVFENEFRRTVQKDYPELSNKDCTNIMTQLRFIT